MEITIKNRGKIHKTVYNTKAPLSTILRDCGMPISLPCGGGGKCGKCRVRASGELSNPGERELRLLSARELSEGIRMACLAEAEGDAVIEIIEDRHRKIVIPGTKDRAAELSSREKLGIAVDIGTTTISASLYDLETGENLGGAGRGNPQTAWGADVITRIERAMAGEGERMASAVRGAIGELILEICPEKTERIKELAVAGNTAMSCLFSGLPVNALAAAPFKPDNYFGENMDIAIPNYHGDGVYVARCISAYVGGDITAAILSSRLVGKGQNSILIDLGTNGEIAGWFSGMLLCCSTAAGPVFESVGITMGMAAFEGAVDHVWLEDDGKIGIHVIGDTAAEGICGSGLVSGVAALLDAGAIDETGAVDDGHGLYEEYNGQPALRLGDSGIYLTQGDIRSVQLAKSAICSGIETLLGVAGIPAAAVENVMIAGGFGYSLDPVSAERIGLLPKGFAGKAGAIGNAALAGAELMLTNASLKRKSVELALNANLVELSGNPYFSERYIENMCFE